MTAATLPAGYRSAVEGDAVRLPDAPRTYVLPRCEQPKSRQLACLTCNQRLANDCQLSEHQLTAPLLVHTVARYCNSHGWEPL